MKILFLAENLSNETALNVLYALKKTGHEIDAVPYFKDGADQCVISYEQGLQVLNYSGRTYRPSDYQGALLWCWGSANLGREYLRLFEDQGVTVLNSTYSTEIADSKIALTEKLRAAGVPVPRSVALHGGAMMKSLDYLTERLGEPPYVVKADYGTQGTGVKFAYSLGQVGVIVKELNAQNADGKGILIQEFIGDPSRPISHYRVFVLGDSVISDAIHVSATSPMNVSNIAAGGIAKFISMNSEMESLALNATHALELEVAGVDLMTYKDNSGQRQIVVLEVNDGPGTKTFDKQNYGVSEQVANYFANKLLDAEANDVLSYPAAKYIA
jgi:ribosomal protein S6--L-glutamate ligase